jgi:hypothetical protein
MRTTILGIIATALGMLSEPASAQRTAAPTEVAPRLSGPKVTMFTINGGLATTADRDVTYQILFEGTTALYRVAEGVRPTSGWLIASQGTARGALQMARGAEGTRTVFLEIRKDAVSPTTITTASITLKYPTQDFVASGNDIYRAKFDFDYGMSLKKISTSGDSCYFSEGEMSAWGNFPIGAAIGIPVAPSPEAICEIKLLLGKNLKAGWTLRSVSAKITSGRSNITPLAGARCDVQAAAYGTNVPALAFIVKHPGSLNPLATVATFCQLVSVVFRGPNDPDFNEGLADIL